MKKSIAVIFSILILSLAIHGATVLSGSIDGRTFTSADNPHIIESDLTISKGSTVVVKPGVVFLFKSFTGINVHGSLLVEGTEEDPIVFTSINDANYNPEADQLPNSFDWNGIYVTQKAEDIKFRNFKLMFSVFGIKSQKDDITLQSGFFKQNGQFHFTINDNIHYVQDNISYSYNPTGSEPEEETPAETKKTTSTSEKDADRDKSKKKKKSSPYKKKKIIGFSLAGLGVACGTVAAITGVKSDDYVIKANSSTTPDDYDDYIKKSETLKSIAIISGVAGGVSIAISPFLFIKRDKSTLKKKVSLNVKAGKQLVGMGFTRYF